MEKVGIRVFLVFVFLSLGLILLDLRGNLVLLRDGSNYLVSPFVFATSAARESFNDTFSFLTFWKSGEARIRNLEERNLELLVKAGRTDVLERENKMLRQQLGVRALAEYHMLPARVLGENRFLLLAVGSNDGVKAGQTVVFKDSLIGKVNRVNAKLAYVQLPTDVNSKIPARVEASGTVQGLVVGQYNSSMLLDQIVQTEKLSEGDAVLTSGAEGGYPQGLLIGKLGKVTSSATALFKNAEVRPIIDISKLDLVFVLLD